MRWTAVVAVYAGRQRQNIQSLFNYLHSISSGTVHTNTGWHSRKQVHLHNVNCTVICICTLVNSIKHLRIISKKVMASPHELASLNL